MQYGKVAKSILTSDSLSQGAKLLYCTLSVYANPFGICYPSVDTLCKDTHFSRNTLYQYLNELKQAHIVEISHSKHSGKYDSNTYQLCDIIHISNHQNPDSK